MRGLQGTYLGWLPHYKRHCRFCNSAFSSVLSSFFSLTAPKGEESYVGRWAESGETRAGVFQEQDLNLILFSPLNIS